MEQLKPCSKCGRTEEVELLDVGECMFWVACEWCGNETGNYGSAEEAVNAWNRRADNDKTQYTSRRFC